MNNNRFKMKAFTGAEATAEAMRQINPDVVPVYPITPQTPIAETFAKFVADGEVDTEIIRVESEHSAMSAAVGASAAGARAMTATSSAGFVFMFEVLGIASGLRLPIVMAVVNRALSGPINIHCDHSDSMSGRDTGWIQIYTESVQEAYDFTFLALKLSEHKNVLLPTMIMQDGFFTSHTVGNVKILNDRIARNFIGEYKPEKYLLNIENPVTMGPLQLFDYNFETKRQEQEAMKNAKQVYLEISKELSKLTGNKYGYFEEYKLDDAEVAIVVLSSTAGTTKEVINKMRKQGKKVGLLKPYLFRPFPYKEIAEALKNIKTVGVLDRSFSFGANAPLFSEIKNSTSDLDKKPKLQSYIFGLGGRNIFEKEIEDVFEQLLKEDISEEEKYIGLKE